MCVCVCVCWCVCVCARARERECVRASERACVRVCVSVSVSVHANSVRASIFCTAVHVCGRERAWNPCVIRTCACGVPSEPAAVPYAFARARPHAQAHPRAMRASARAAPCAHLQAFVAGDVALVHAERPRDLWRVCKVGLSPLAAPDAKVLANDIMARWSVEAPPPVRDMNAARAQWMFCERRLLAQRAGTDRGASSSSVSSPSLRSIGSWPARSSKGGPFLVPSKYGFEGACGSSFSMSSSML